MSEHLHHAMLPRELKPLPLSDMERTRRSLWGIHQVLKRIERLLTFVLERLEELSFPSQETGTPRKAETHRKLPERITRPRIDTKADGAVRMRRLRERLGLNQGGMGARLGVTGTMISHIEARRSRITPRLDAKIKRLERE